MSFDVFYICYLLLSMTWLPNLTVGCRLIKLLRSVFGLVLKQQRLLDGMNNGIDCEAWT